MKRYFSIMLLSAVFFLLAGFVSAFAGTPPAKTVGATSGKISQLVDVESSTYVAVLEDGAVTAFFFQPDPPGDADDAFHRSVLKDAYDGKTTSPAWIPADKSLYGKCKPWYQYDGKNYTKLKEATQSCS